MYCHNCGQEISDQSKFCPYCGTQQNHSKKTFSGKSRFWRNFRRILLVLIIVPIAVFILAALFADREEDNSDVLRETSAATYAATETEAEAAILEDGWHELYGDRYYTQDGKKFVDLHEINGNLYYFDDEGVLAVNEKIPYDGATLQAGHDGRIKAIIFDAIYGTWAEESYRFGNGGSSAVLELAIEVENCDSFRFYLESNGERGAKVNGSWKIYIRCNGKWEFVETINYREPNGYFDITLDGQKTFDAITAYPTVQGNASYSSLFYLQNVHCLL